MIITSHLQNIIEIYPCLLKLSRKQESVTDGQTAAITISPHRYRGGIKSNGSLWSWISDIYYKFQQHHPLADIMWVGGLGPELTCPILLQG